MKCLLLLDQQSPVEGVTCQLYRECLFSQNRMFENVCFHKILYRECVFFNFN